MFGQKMIVLLLLSIVSLVRAQSTCSASTQEYNDISGFPRSDGCVPTNYLSAMDLGNTSPDDAGNRCRSQCTTQGTNCAGYIAQLNKAADSNAYSGTCFFYGPGQVPSAPRQCADKPTELLGQAKDNTLGCFSSSKASATAFCSSYLGIGLQTKYTSTTTPTVTSTKPVKTTVYTTTTIVEGTVTRTTIASSVTSTTTATTTSIFTFGVNNRRLVRRTVAPPACVSANTPSTRLSSACRCLNIVSSTTSLLSTAIAKTTTLTSISTSLLTSRTTTTSTTAKLTSTATTTVPTTVTATTTSTCPVGQCGPCVLDQCLQAFRASSEASVFCQFYTAPTVTVTTTPTVSVTTVSTLSSTPTSFVTATSSQTVTPSSSVTALFTTSTTASTTTTSSTTTTTTVTNFFSVTTSTYTTITVTRGVTTTYTTTIITTQSGYQSIPPNRKKRSATVFTTPGFVTWECVPSQISSACNCLGVPKNTMTDTVTTTASTVTVIVSSTTTTETESATTVTDATTTTTTSASTVTTTVGSSTTANTVSTAVVVSYVSTITTQTNPRVVSRASVTSVGAFTSTSTSVQTEAFPNTCPDAAGTYYYASNGVRYIRNCGHTLTGGTLVANIAPGGAGGLDGCIEWCVRYNSYNNPSQRCEEVKYYGFATSEQCQLYYGATVITDSDQTNAALYPA